MIVSSLHLAQDLSTILCIFDEITQDFHILILALIIIPKAPLFLEFFFQTTPPYFYSATQSHFFVKQSLNASPAVIQSPPLGLRFLIETSYPLANKFELALVDLKSYLTIFRC